MKKTGLLFSFLLLSQVLLAQEIPENDLNPGESGLEELELSPFEFGDGSKSISPSAVSLRVFCPPPRNQAGMPDGARLGLAYGYGAMTILKARQNNWTSAQIQREAFSAWFPFELLPKKPASCLVANGFVAAMRQVLTESGNLKAVAYDAQPTTCQRTPSPAEREQALRYRIDRLDKVFDLSTRDPDKLRNIRQALQAGRPVVVLLQVDRGFAPFRGETWQPNDQLLGQKALFQPVVVIGYDDRRRAFEFLNSMGTSWGNRGFAWISYDDFVRRVPGGTALVDRSDAPNPPAPTPNPVTVRPKPTVRPNPVTVPPTPVVVRPKPAVVLRGTSVLEQLRAVSETTIQKTPVPVRLRETYYEIQNNLAINEMVQLVLNQLPRYGYVYIFSIDPNRKVELHFPQPGESAYVADDEARLVFPRPRIESKPDGTLERIEQGFSKEVQGDEWLVTLYSKQPLEPTQLNGWMAQLARPDAPVMATLEQELGSQRVPWRSVRFEPQAMRFDVTADSPGSVMPLVLKINGH